MAENVFRRTIRLRIPSNSDCLDSLLIDHMTNLEKDSTHLMQEWIRNALRDSFKQERLALLGNASEQAAKE